MSHRTTIEPRRARVGAVNVPRSSGANVAVMSLAPGAVDAVGGAAGDSPRTWRGVAAAEVGVEDPDVALGSKLGDARVEVGLGDDLDVEQHLGVVLAAQFGALATIVADPLRNDLELVPDAGDEVHLVE